ncbi:hypothetical protein [Streptomyces sp. 8L]|uniref:hypothetical protein n=1 Tax=Streptomyces sp. 8L TaxID=2877242 RepID=UPI001CD2BFB4|nr:hypothetical protein [Streptomyces sp. 8L]MCA1222841.1 hypothetical protein [Streptomyces sp. 8L]
MAAFIFSQDEPGTFTVRKALFRMILTRAERRLAEEVDVAEIQMSEAMEGISFRLLDEDQRTRAAEAVLEGTRELRTEITEGKPLEESVLPGVEEKLDELVSFLQDHTAR